MDIRKKAKIFFTIFLVGVGFSFATTAFGDNAPIFSVNPLENKHQVGNKEGYFNLQEKPGEKDELKIQIINPSQEDKKFIVTLTDGNTNDEGQIDYTGNKKNSELLTQSFTSIAENPKPVVSVKKESTKTISIPISMPKKEFTGVILGGITVREVNPSSFNTYSYTTAVVLMNKYYDSINKKESIKKEKIEYDKNQQNFNIQLSNSTGFLSIDNHLLIKVKNIWGKEIYSYEKENIDIAPHQVFTTVTDELSNFAYQWKIQINNSYKTFYTLKLGSKIIYCSVVQIVSIVLCLVLFFFIIIVLWLYYRNKKKNKI